MEFRKGFGITFDIDCSNWDGACKCVARNQERQRAEDTDTGRAGNKNEWGKVMDGSFYGV